MIAPRQPRTISVLCPTRGRDSAVVHHWCSAYDNAADNERVGISLRFDEDMSVPLGWCTITYAGHTQVRIGPRADSATLFNDCASAATGEILMMGGDDMRFRTPGWDVIVDEMMWDDGLGCLYPEDGQTGNCVHPIVGREWYELFGFFCPPGYNWAYVDTWIADVARRAGRLKKLHNVLCEHLHFSFDKSVYDETYAYRRRDPELLRHDHERWMNTVDEREDAAAMVRGAI